jgi:hypothetical protein
MDQASSASSRSRFKTPGRSSGDGSTAGGTGSRDAVHPFENTKDLLVVLANDAIDIEEEGRLYDELRAVTQSVSSAIAPSFRFFHLSDRCLGRR